MPELAATLAGLNTPDRDARREALVGLADWLNGRADSGDAVPPASADAIAEGVAAILLDDAEAPDLRASAAFVLGKTHAPGAYLAVLRAIASPAPLPRDIARQCAFAFDVLDETVRPSEPALPPSEFDPARDFRRHGIPWDDAGCGVAIEDV